MTSRRSRLKAVANLAVRRKPIISQGSTNEAASDNLTQQKVLPPNLDYNNINEIPQNNEPENITIGKPPNIESDKNVTVLNVSSDINTFTAEKYLDNTENSLNVENELSGTCSLNNNITDYVGNSKISKPKENQPENQLENENVEINFNILCDDGKIVKEGSKSYAVLTPKSTTDYHLSTNPNINSPTYTALNQVYAPEEFEVQIYTEIQSDDAYNSRDVNGDCDSIIDPGVIEPVLKNLSNCNREKEINNENVNNFSEPTYTELRNVSNNVYPKSALRTTVYNRTYSSGSDKFYKNPVGRIKDANSSNTAQNVSPDLQNVSQFRRKRSKYNDFTKKLADAKREFQRKYEKSKPDRSTLKMIDLIFYNPVTNPMESKTKFEKKEMVGHQSEFIENLLNDENADEPEPMECDTESQSCDGSDTQSGNKMPVPQVKIGVNGEIILDEKSLVIETTDAKKGRENLQNSLPVFEDRGSKVSYYGGKSKKSKDWADFETKRFYKALNTIGPDFTLMQQYFPKRSRLELKNKFKREERLNKNLIDKALNNPSEFDMTQLEQDLDVERRAEEEIEMRLCSTPKPTPKKPKIKSSFLSREMIESDSEPKENQSNADDVSVKILSENEKNKKKKEFDFVFQKLLAKESEKPLHGFPEITRILQDNDGSAS